MNSQKSMVEYGKKILVNEKIDNYLEHKNFEEIKKKIKETNYNCLTMIGIFEHLEDSDGFMQIIKEIKILNTYIFVYQCILFQ